jgi:pimeloyl-ACP methyl ester carboxylesterase
MQNAKGLEYEVRGAREPVRLIHGSHVAHAFLPPMVEPALADRFCVIRYHRRGFAGSAPHTGPFSIEQQARDALELVGGEDWRVEVEKALPGAPALAAWSFDAEPARRLSRPV